MKTERKINKNTDGKKRGGVFFYDTVILSTIINFTHLDLHLIILNTFHMSNSCQKIFLGINLHIS